MICLGFVSDQCILVPQNQFCYSQMLQIDIIDKEKWSVLRMKSFTLNLILFFLYFFQQRLRLTSFSLLLFFSVFLWKNCFFVKIYNCLKSDYNKSCKFEQDFSSWEHLCFKNEHLMFSVAGTTMHNLETRVHSILDIGVICFQFWTGPDLKIAPFERVLKNLLDTGPWD